MPFQKNAAACKKCGETDKLTRLKWHSKNKKYYLQTTCKECEYQENLSWRIENKTEWAALVRKSYFKVTEPTTTRRNVLGRSQEDRKVRARLKSESRCTRAKKARVIWDKELTDFVYKEAHDLRRKRNELFGFEWHIDHIIPLRGKDVCGLHVWNNFAVIPKVENLRKGNRNSISKERETAV